MIIDATYLLTTDLAVLIVYEREEIWIPLSQVVDDIDFAIYRRDDPIQMEITDWIAGVKGLL